MTDNLAFSDFEKRLMETLIQKASLMKGLTHPNPLVAAAVYRDETILGIGVHQEKGQDHAEVLALKAVDADVSGASMMVTLEPCTHQGSTPPCVEAIKQAGITSLVYAMQDPFNLVRQSPARAVLEAAGIQVRDGLCQTQALALNEGYAYFHQQKRPLVILKAGMSLDGRIALPGGKRQMLTGQSSLEAVHEIRAGVNGILVGRGTLELDDPLLTVRYDKACDGAPLPVVFVVASSLDRSRSFKIFDSGAKTVLLGTTESVVAQESAFDEQVFVGDGQGNLDWQAFFEYCVNHDLYSILLEGGAGVFSSAMQAKIVSKCEFFIAPKLLGQSEALSVLTIDGMTSLSEAFQLIDVSYNQCGEDMRVTGYCQSV